jgi:hypothetical protein
MKENSDEFLLMFFSFFKIKEEEKSKEMGCSDCMNTDSCIGHTSFVI